MRPAIPGNEIARRTLELAAQPDLGVVVSRFLDLIRGWATPLAVVAAAEDAGARDGWRVLPALVVGLGPLGVERSIARLVEQSPDCRRQPVMLPPSSDVPGVARRDDWIVPWWHEGQSGVLVVRGVPQGGPANLGDALVAVGATVWPRVLGSPAARIQALVRDLQEVAGRLQQEAAQQVERLQAATPPPASVAPPEAEGGGEGRAHDERFAGEAVRQAEEQRDQARAEAGRLAAHVEALQAAQAAAAWEIEELRRTAHTAVAAAAPVRDNGLADRIATLEAEQAGAGAEAARLRAASQAAQEALQQAEQQRDEARGEAARLVARIEASQAEQGAGVSALREAEEQREQARSAAEQLSARLQAVEAEQAALAAEVQRHSAAAQSAQAAAGQATEQRDQAQVEIARLAGQIQALEAAHGGATAEMAQLRASADAVEAAKAAQRQAEEQRDQAGAEVARAHGRIEALQAEQAAAESELAQLRESAAALAAARESVRQAEEQRDHALDALLAEQGAATARREELARATEAARTAAEAASGAEAQRDQAKAEVERLAAQVQAVRAEHGTATTQMEALRRESTAAADAASKVLAERDEALSEVHNLSATIEAIIAERASSNPEEVEQLRQAADTATAAARSAEAALAVARQHLTETQSELAVRSHELEQARAAQQSLPPTAPPPAPGQPPAGAAVGVAADSLRSVFVAMRRTPFLPPPLKASLEEAAAHFREDAGDLAAWMSVAILDREPQTIEALVGDLEDVQLKVKVAQHPEELAVLLRTSEGRDVGVLICDVMAFRPDVNVAGMFRGWEKDKPGLKFYLSFNAADPVELERGRRVPLSLLAGHVQRPMRAPALIEALQILSKKMGKPTDKIPSPGAP